MKSEHDIITRIENIRKALGHPAWRVRVVALRYLAQLDKEATAPLLSKATMDENKAVRIVALEVCAELASALPVTLVLAALGDSEWSVRAAAVWALGHFSQRAPLNRLLSILHDQQEDIMVRASALHALGSLGSRTPIAHLSAALNDPAWHLREVAALLLGKRPGNVAITALLNAVRDEDSFVRATAARSLGHMDEPLLQGVLVGLLNDEDSAVCQASAQSLGELSASGVHEYGSFSEKDVAAGPPGPGMVEEDAANREYMGQAASVRRYGDVEFVMLEPAQLPASPALLQALDNQWLPSSLLQPMLAGKLTYKHISTYLNNLVRSEYVQALLNYRQLVVNRAYLYNNPVIYNDYLPGRPEREAFKALLRLGVIIPVLFNEASPDAIPQHSVQQEGFAAWQQICHEVRMSCLRASWNDERNQEIVEQHLLRRFHTFALTAHTRDVARYTRNLGLEVEMASQLEDRLYQVAQACKKNREKEGKFISRNVLYKLYITSGDNPAQRDYSVESELAEENVEQHGKLFTAEIKQLVDLAYNSYLADIVHGYLLTPADSLSRTALQDRLQPGAGLQVVTTPTILAMLDSSVVPIGGRETCLKTVNVLRLRDIIVLRRTNEWASYITYLERLRQNLIESPQLIGKIYQSYIDLNHKMVLLAQQHSRESNVVVERIFVPELVVNVAGAKIALQWHGDRLLYMYTGEPQPDVELECDQWVSVSAQLNIKVQKDRDGQTSLFTTIEFLSGVTRTAHELWQEIRQYVRQSAAFKAASN